MPVYTAWPVEADVLNRLTGVGLTLRGDSSYQQERIAEVTAEVVAEVARETRRQFIADTVASTRFYDGSGTAELEIDEFVEFDGAAAIGLNADPGYPLANVIPAFQQGLPWTRLIRGQGGLPAFQVAAVYQPVPTIFPAGRQNIAVTAKWGWGVPIGTEVGTASPGGPIVIASPQIPTDLWGAVAQEIARRVGNEALFNPNGGMVASWAEGDEREAYVKGGLDAIGWEAKYAEKLDKYKRRAGKRLRNTKPAMI